MRKVSAERLAETRAARKKMLADPLHPVTRMRREILGQNAETARDNALLTALSKEIYNTGSGARQSAMTSTLLSTYYR